MRRVKTILAAMLYIQFAPAALAEPAPCLQPGEAQGFSIIGLKSTLMVDALTCNMNSEYNSFMTRFQPQILDAQHLMDGYFERMDGLAGQAREDEFTTQLANMESAAASQNARFCGQAVKQFNLVMALNGTMDMVHYAASLPSVPPPNTNSCPATPALPPAAPPLVVAQANEAAAAPFTGGKMAPPPPHNLPVRSSLHAPQRTAGLHKRHLPAPALAGSPYLVSQSI